MADVQSSAPATPAATATTSAAAFTTIGSSIDAEIVVLKSRIASLESAAKTDWSAVKQWVKTNWPHAVTWTGLAAASPTIVDIVKKLI